MTFTEYAIKNNLVTTTTELDDFIRIPFSKQFGSPVTRKMKLDAYRTIKPEVMMDAVREVSGQFLFLDAKKSHNNYEANIYEDKILARQESDSSYWG